MRVKGGQAVALAALAGLAGTALQLQQAELWPPGAHAALMALGLSAAVLAFASHRRGSSAGPWCAAAAVALLAAGATGWRAADRLSQTLAPAQEGQDLVLTGWVAQMPQIDEDGLRFLFELDPGQGVAPRRIWLGWSGGWQEGAFVAGAPAALKAGERWALPVRLKRPHGVLNPAGFDTELWWFEQGVGAVGQVRTTAPTDPVRLQGPRPWALLQQVEGWRQRLRDAILLRQSGDARSTGLLAALAVGDQAAVDTAGWDLFRATSTAHLVVISGMHITLFAWLAAGVVGLLWRRSRRLMHAVPTPVAQRWAGLVLATGYALLAGWGVPAQRTTLMLAGAVLLRQLGLNWPAGLICLVAGACVVAVDPWALLQPGFWLSFVAVLLLMASEPERRLRAMGHDEEAIPRWRAALVSGLRSQLVATVGLAPLSLIFFQQISLVGLLANAAAVPVITFLVTPLALLGLAWAPVWQVAEWVLTPLLAWLEWLAAWPQAVWSVPVAPAWALPLGLAGAALAVMPLPWRVRLLGLPMLLPLLDPAVPRPETGRFELVAADVGQGSAVLVRTRHHLLVFDAGPKFSRDSDAGRLVLWPLLQARGERRIDELVLSHRDTDHVGGAPVLLARLPVGLLRSSLEPGHPLLSGPVPHRPCLAGQGWAWDGVQFQMLHPLTLPAPPGTPPNAVSCVLRVQDALGRSALLTGDIEAAQEQALVGRMGPGLKSDLLIVPHHGSRTSSTPEFLAAVRPRVAVMQQGYRNRFGHPHPAVLATYAAAGIQVVRTDQCGAWSWSGGSGTCSREAPRRYWHWRADATAEQSFATQDAAGSMLQPNN